MALLSRSKKNAAAGGRGAPRQRGARAGQIRAVWRMTRQADPKLLPLTLAAFLAPFVLLLVVGLVVGPFWLWLPLALLVGLLVTMIVFGRRAQRVAFSGVEGQVGAAAAVLNSMRGNWRVAPAVAFNKEQELVHRVLGRPGIVLVAEAAPGMRHRGTRNLMANEKKKLSRFLSSDVPVYEVLVGDEEGQVPLRGLEKHFAKLPRNIKPKQVNELDAKLKALPPPLPIPKGPMPTTGRIPRGKMR